MLNVTLGAVSVVMVRDVCPRGQFCSKKLKFVFTGCIPLAPPRK